LKKNWAKDLYLQSAKKVPFQDFIQNVSQAPSKCLSKWINGIISKIPHRNLKNIFVQGSYESLEGLEGKTGEGPFF